MTKSPFCSTGQGVKQMDRNPLAALCLRWMLGMLSISSGKSERVMMLCYTDLQIRISRRFGSALMLSLALSEVR